MNEQWARKVHELPGLPETLAKVRALIQRDDVDFDDLATAILCEPALAADMLRLANSSLYGLGGRVRSVRDAVSVLGLRNLDMLLTAAALRSGLRPRTGSGLDTLPHWRHGVASGLCAHHLATELGMERDVAFTAGLLHDLGRLALACVAPEALAAAQTLSQQQDIPLIDAERQHLGTDHAVFGALVAQRWHFGNDIVEAIRWHHEPSGHPGSSDSPKQPAPLLADLLHVADAMVHALDINQLPHERVPRIDPVSWNRLRLSDGTCLNAFERTESQLQSLCAALGLQ